MKRSLSWWLSGILVLAFAAGLRCADSENCVEEVCNGLDDNCDGRTDESLFQDCSTLCGTGTRQCVGGDWTDCSAPAGQPETCNSIDDDCDGLTDEGVDLRSYRDADGDAYGDPATVREGCSARPGDVANGDDCDDTDPAIHPRATELCDGVDDDCSGTPDEGCDCVTGESRACGDWSETPPCSLGSQDCTAGTWSACSGGVRPADETCNGLDDDCDATVDDGLEPDAHEPDDLCSSARELAAITEDGGRDPLHELAGGGTLYKLTPGADVDWYSVATTEDSGACVPFTSECCYRFTAVLEPPAGLPHDTWRLCLYQGGDCAGLGSEKCTAAGDWIAADAAYLITMCYSGSCGTEDGTTFRMKVDHPGAPTGACEAYELRYNFYRTDDDCP